MMMRYSIENRVPFLSRRLFDIAINTPDSIRYSKYQGKLGSKNLLKNMITINPLLIEKRLASEYPTTIGTLSL